MERVEFTTKDYPELLKGNIGCSIAGAWGTIVKEALDQLEILRANGVDIQVAQIKEKFGTLRIYTRGKDWEAAEPIVEQAQEKASNTCSVCGSNEDVQRGYREKDSGWLLNLCKEHRYSPPPKEFQSFLKVNSI